VVEKRKRGGVEKRRTVNGATYLERNSLKRKTVGEGKSHRESRKKSKEEGGCMWGEGTRQKII